MAAKEAVGGAARDVKALLGFFLGAALLLAQLVAVFVFTGLASVGYSYMVADSYAESGEPPSYFPLVATVSGEPPSDYRLVRWGERDAGVASRPQRSFFLSVLTSEASQIFPDHKPLPTCCFPHRPLFQDSSRVRHLMSASSTDPPSVEFSQMALCWPNCCPLHHTMAAQRDCALLEQRVLPIDSEQTRDTSRRDHMNIGGEESTTAVNVVAQGQANALGGTRQKAAWHPGAGRRLRAPSRGAATLSMQGPSASRVGGGPPQSRLGRRPVPVRCPAPRR